MAEDMSTLGFGELLGVAEATLADLQREHPELAGSVATRGAAETFGMAAEAHSAGDGRSLHVATRALEGHVRAARGPDFARLGAQFRAEVEGGNDLERLLDIVEAAAPERDEHGYRIYRMQRGWGGYDPAGIVENFGYSLPTREAVEFLGRYLHRDDGVLELGAGLGVWACVMSHLTGAWIATDFTADAAVREHGHAHKPYCEVAYEDAPLEYYKNMRGQDPNVLFMNWPAPGARWPLKYVQTFNGRAVVILGGTDAAMTADQGVFDYLDENWGPPATECLTRNFRMGHENDGTMAFVWVRGGHGVPQGGGGGV